MLAIINIQDSVLGSWHQVTVEQASNPTPNHPYLIRVDGTQLQDHYELYQRIQMMLGSWSDDLEGITEKDQHL